MSDDGVQDVIDWASSNLNLGPLRFHRFLQKQTSAEIMELKSCVAGTENSIIVRRYCDDAWLKREPHLPANEVRMTQFAFDSGLPVPMILGWRASSPPLVAMTSVKGGVLSSSRIDRAQLESVARLAHRIHAISAPDPINESNLYAPHYLHTSISPRWPKWSQVPSAWKVAIGIYNSFKTSPKRMLLHRDLHFGNILYSGDQQISLIDWVTSSFGDPQADIAHMRWNLMMSLGSDAVSVFTHAYYRNSGAQHDPVWDIYALVGALPDLEELSGEQANNLDLFIQDAVLAIGVL